jgi:hypothetical protein
MDVSAITTGTGTPAPAVSENPVQTGTVAPASTDEVQDQTTAPPSSTTPTPHSVHAPNTLAPAIAKLFGSSADPQPVPLNVSYRVLKGDLGEIVTVFTDPKTGREIAQFPPEILIGLATFFDQQSGATLDQNA